MLQPTAPVFMWGLGEGVGVYTGHKQRPPSGVNGLSLSSQPRTALLKPVKARGVSVSVSVTVSVSVITETMYDYS